MKLWKSFVLAAFDGVGAMVSAGVCSFTVGRAMWLSKRKGGGGLVDVVVEDVKVKYETD